jgi:hypothetical protein
MHAYVVAAAYNLIRIASEPDEHEKRRTAGIEVQHMPSNTGPLVVYHGWNDTSADAIFLFASLRGPTNKEKNKCNATLDK